MSDRLTRPTSHVSHLARSRRLWAAAAIALVAAPSAASSRAAPSLRDVLARAGEYAVAYGNALASVIADEDFHQELVDERDGTVLEQRRLHSEMAFVKLGAEWLAFRNVFRVDDRAIADASGRLERLFRETPESAFGRARAITAESAHHNLGPVQRTLNVPTTILHFLLPQHQHRFRFRKAGEARIGDETAWVVTFREQDRATFIRTPEGRAAPAEGRLWIVPEDGRLLRSQLAVKGEVRADIEVAWQRDGRLSLWVPVEMRERYRGAWTSVPGGSARSGRFELRGVAKYSNYRRFDVDVRIVR